MRKPALAWRQVQQTAIHDIWRRKGFLLQTHASVEGAPNTHMRLYIQRKRVLADGQAQHLALPHRLRRKSCCPVQLDPNMLM